MGFLSGFHAFYDESRWSHQQLARWGSCDKVPREFGQRLLEDRAATVEGDQRWQVGRRLARGKALDSSKGNDMSSDANTTTKTRWLFNIYDNFTYQSQDRSYNDRWIKITSNTIAIPLSPSVEYSLHLTKISILKQEWSTKKNSFERRVYESVDVRRIFWVIYRLYIGLRKAVLRVSKGYRDQW